MPFSKLPKLSRYPIRKQASVTLVKYTTLCDLPTCLQLEEVQLKASQNNIDETSANSKEDTSIRSCPAEIDIDQLFREKEDDSLLDIEEDIFNLEDCIINLDDSIDAAIEETNTTLNFEELDESTDTDLIQLELFPTPQTIMLGDYATESNTSGVYDNLLDATALLKLSSETTEESTPLTQRPHRSSQESLISEMEIGIKTKKRLFFLNRKMKKESTRRRRSSTNLATMGWAHVHNCKLEFDGRSG